VVGICDAVAMGAVSLFASGEPLPDKCYITKTTQLLVLGLKGTCLGLRAMSQLASRG
jgi:hypothetical protein